jgi:uncharacterized protein YcgL (UPF0745 family)
MSDTNKKAKELFKQAMELAKQGYYAQVAGDSFKAGNIQVQLDVLDKKAEYLFGAEKYELFEVKIEEALNAYGCTDVEQVVDSQGFATNINSQVLYCLGVSEALGMSIIDEMIA